MHTLSERHPTLWTALLALVSIGTALLAGRYIAGAGMEGVGLLIALPIVLTIVCTIVARPRVGVSLLYHLSFTLFAIGRILYTNIPIGLSIDGVMLLTLIGALFNKKKNIGVFQSAVFFATAIWFVFTVFELFNPEARSKQAWFFAARGVSIYMIQIVVIGLLLITERKDLYRFVNTWMAYSAFAALWAFKQQYIGLTTNEQRWMDEGGAQTHILFGNLRSFSIYSDAGQYGAAAAHASLFAMILAVETKNNLHRLKYIFIAVTSFWGYALAGSRGPLIVFAGGMMAYLLLRRNLAVIAVGMVLAAGAYGFLKFTYIAQGNYQVQRMRSALDPNDPSLQVRLANQKKLSGYMDSRPIGAGIGSGGEWGRRFSPGTFLAETALDSWYVKIWVETGVVGLSIHILTLLMIAAAGYRNIIRLRDPVLASTMRGLFSGYIGILLASYGNQILGQTPTSTVMYITIATFHLCSRFDTKEESETAEEDEQAA